MLLRVKPVLGFTLIELMIVVTIIAVMAMIAVPMFGAMLARAKDGQTLGNLGALRAAIATYFADTEGDYPHFPPPYGQPAGYGSILETALVPNYIKAIPSASPSGWHHPASNQVFQVWNQTGNEDDPANGFGQGWKYDANPFDIGVFPNVPQFGSLMVLCTHTDAKNINWSTY